MNHLRPSCLLFLLSCLALAGGSVVVAEEAVPAAESAVTTPLTREEFLGTLTRDLSTHFNLEGSLSLDFFRDWAAPERVAKLWEVQVVEYPTVATSSMLVRCRILADGESQGESTIMLRASLWRDVWIARQPLAYGADFDASLLDVRQADLLRERDALPATVGDRTFQFTRSVQAGRVLSWRDIALRPLVRKGNFVEVSAADGQLVITMRAVAMQNGANGEAVKVRNMDSKKDFTAFVVDENRVQVRF